jgi:enamine deaminase RidA (YjgF/YER057c/UK114 family)
MKLDEENKKPVSRHNPPTMWDMTSFGFSHISVVESGRLAFLSGQIATTLGSKGVPDDLASQARLATANLAAALEELKASPEDIVMLRVYVVDADREKFQQAVAPLRELVGDAMPSITTVGVQALFMPEIKVEIEMTVRLP